MAKETIDKGSKNINCIITEGGICAVYIPKIVMSKKEIINELKYHVLNESYRIFRITGINNKLSETLKGLNVSGIKIDKDGNPIYDSIIRKN